MAWREDETIVKSVIPAKFDLLSGKDPQFHPITQIFQECHILSHYLRDKDSRMLLLANINNILHKMFNIEKCIDLRVNSMHFEKFPRLNNKNFIFWHQIKKNSNLTRI